VKPRLSDLQVELGLQTGVKRHNQLLHYNGRDVADFMSANDVISTRLKTSEDQPLALLPTTNVTSERRPANIHRILRELFRLWWTASVGNISCGLQSAPWSWKVMESHGI